MKAAIEHANGHGASSFSVGSVSGTGDGAQTLDVTSVYKGTSGNNLPTEDVANLAIAEETAGVDAVVGGLSTVTTVKAISETSSSAGSKIELFIISPRSLSISVCKISLISILVFHFQQC